MRVSLAVIGLSMNAIFVPYPDPGIIPDKPSPKDGETIHIAVEGLPPHKDISKSIRNPKHPHYDRFVNLRKAAIDTMGGRCWYEGGVSLELTVCYTALDDEVSSADYLRGIMDTLDGSHGPFFTYLPVVYQDDCQVWHSSSKFLPDDKNRYEIKITFGPQLIV